MVKKTMKISLAGVAVAVVVAGTVYALAGHARSAVEGRTNPAHGTSSVVIQAKAPQPLYNYQQQDIYHIAKQVLLNPPQTTFDASKFTQYVYAKAGLALPRTIAEQAQVGKRIASPGNLAEGDLVFFDLNNTPSQPTFVGIYLTGGQVAAETTHGLRAFNMNSGYWANKFLFGVRLG